MLKTEALPIGSTGAEPVAMVVEGAGMIDLQPNCDYLAARSGQLRPSPVNTTDTDPLATFAQLAISPMSRCDAEKIHRDIIQYAVQYKASASELPQAREYQAYPRPATIKLRARENCAPLTQSALGWRARCLSSRRSPILRAITF
jgi:hypothetical protein